jgi:hypothetical protein
MPWVIREKLKENLITTEGNAEGEDHYFVRAWRDGQYLNYEGRGKEIPRIIITNGPNGIMIAVSRTENRFNSMMVMIVRDESIFLNHHLYNEEENEMKITNRKFEESMKPREMENNVCLDLLHKYFHLVKPKKSPLMK